MKSALELVRQTPPYLLLLLGFGSAIAYGLLKLHAVLQAVAN